MFRPLLLGSLLLLTAAVSTAATPVSDKARADDWPQWRGVHRDGHSPDTGLLKEWPADGPPLVWEAKGAGTGYSSLAVTGGRVYTLGDGPSTADDKDEYVTCFDATTGKQVWKTRVGPPWTSGAPSWQHARSTPTVVGDRLYVITPHGLLVCMDTDGKEQWQKDLKKDLGGQKGDGWGYSESVLIDGDRLICTPGGKDATMAALNPKDGEVIWKAEVDKGWGAGHSSVIVSEVGGTRVYVQAIGGGRGAGVVGVRAKDGKVLWTHNTRGTVALIPTPIVQGDLVFATAGYGTGGTLLRQVPSSDGGVDVKQVYPLQRQLDNKHGGVVLVGKLLYGDTSDAGSPWCADLMTGKVRWKKPRGGAGGGSASMAYADGHLYVHYADGTMALVKASPEGYKAVSTFKTPHSGLPNEPSWAHPVVTGKKLFVREGDYILCYDLRSK
jgi:outer membrane protein assembly factor BamB